ncbi:MAG: GNAT family N-acetyltransferase [Nocardioides sp.]
MQWPRGTAQARRWRPWEPRCHFRPGTCCSARGWPTWTRCSRWFTPATSPQSASRTSPPTTYGSGSRRRSPDPTGTPYEQWLVARVDGAVVGVLRCADRSADGGGWVRNLGVLTAHRGLGIARVLLDRAFATFHARGFTWAGLGVDRANETGAHRLYESAGMRLQFQADAWELTVPAATATTPAV